MLCRLQGGGDWKKHGPTRLISERPRRCSRGREGLLAAGNATLVAPLADVLSCVSVDCSEGVAEAAAAVAEAVEARGRDRRASFVCLLPLTLLCSTAIKQANESERGMTTIFCFTCDRACPDTMAERCACG